MLRASVLFLSLAIVVGAAAPPPLPAARDADVVASIALVTEGDFEAAVTRLEGALPRLAASPGMRADLAAAHVYLGIARLELERESEARAEFREALAVAPDMRLEGGPFSAQVIRVFEQTRASLPPLPPPAKAEPAPRKKSLRPLVLVGGGVAAAGVALAAGGGGSEPSVTTSSTTTTSTTTTTTTTTTTQPPAADCRYTVMPSSVGVDRDGGTGSCNVRPSRSSCRWTAESTESWLVITSGRTGTGNGTVRFRADGNEGSPRKGRLRLAEAHDARCEVQQGGEDLRVTDASLQWSSELHLEGGSGQVILNGSTSRFQGTGRSLGVAAGRPGEARIEAVVVEGRHRPGTWRFELSGSYRPGTLRVVAGDVQQLAAGAITFRLKGVPGERLAFAFRNGP